jgi:hypothetical protein
MGCFVVGGGDMARREGGYTTIYAKKWVDV